MSKPKKGNREAKKPKTASVENKKHKKDPKRYDGTITGLFGGSQ